jgi:hypothetical protein
MVKLNLIGGRRMGFDFLKYKGRPLIRCKDQIFYGDPSNSQVTLIHVDSEDDGIPNKLSVGLISSASAKKGNIFNPVKYSMKDSLFECIDLASAWLDRAEKSN